MKILSFSEWAKLAVAPSERDDKGRFIKGTKNPNKNRVERKCLMCSKLFWVVGSKVKEGKGKYCGRYCDNKSRIGKRNSIHTEFKVKNGNTSEYMRLRNRFIREWRVWREAVFSRDNYTCQECNIRGGVLHPHHIKSFVEYPAIRFSIDNGMTLCKSCHYKVELNFWK